MEWHKRHFHLGSRRLYDLIRLTCHNPFTRALVEETVKNCPTCESQRRLLPATTVGKIMIPDKPGEYLELDHFSPFGRTADRRGFKTCISIKDRFSKVVACIPAYSYSHSEIAYHLSIYFQLNGVPKRIKLDNAFKKSHEIENFARAHDIVLEYSPVYKPSSNGDVERVHRSLRYIIQQLLHDGKVPLERWADCCSIACDFINSTPHYTTRFAPTELHRRFINSDIYGFALPSYLKEKWKLAKDRMTARRNQQLHETKVAPKLPKFTKIWALLGPYGKKKKVAAKVINDTGHTVLIEKTEENGRYKYVTVHKSDITLRLE